MNLSIWLPSKNNRVKVQTFDIGTSEDVEQYTIIFEGYPIQGFKSFINFLFYQYVSMKIIVDINDISIYKEQLFDLLLILFDGEDSKKWQIRYIIEEDKEENEAIIYFTLKLSQNNLLKLLRMSFNMWFKKDVYLKLQYIFDR